MWVEKGNCKLNNGTQYAEGLDEVTMRKVPWHLWLCRNNPIEGGIITISYICLSHRICQLVHTENDVFAKQHHQWVNLVTEKGLDQPQLDLDPLDCKVIFLLETSLVSYG